MAFIFWTMEQSTKKKCWNDSVHLIEGGKVIIANSLMKSINSFFSSAGILTGKCSEEKFTKNTGSDNSEEATRDVQFY